MNPSWYDLLGVEPSASSDEIRAAWRASVADLDPTDRRFRVLNRAAEVLLDPAARAAYDDELAAQDAADDSAEARRVTPAAPRPVTEPVTRRSADRAKAPAETEPADHLEKRETTDRSPGWLRRRVPTWVIAVAVVVAVLLAALTVVAWTRPHERLVTDEAAGSASEIEASAREAQTAAEQAAVPLLSYDYRHLEQDAEAAHRYLTDDYREKYDQLFETIKGNAPRVKAVVTTEVLASGIVRVDGDRVDVLVFVDRPTTNLARSVVYHDHAVVHMEQVGDEWLVDGLASAPLAG